MRRIKRSFKRDAMTVEALYQTPENAAFTQKITRFGRARQWEEAKEVFHQVKDKNTIIYSAMLACADQCRRFEEGIELFEEMKTKGVVCNSVTYCSALSMYAMARDAVAVEALLQEARNSGVLVNNAHWGCLLKAYREEGDAQKAWETLQRMRTYDRCHVVHYTIVVAAIAKAKHAGRITPEEVGQRLRDVEADMLHQGTPMDSHFVETKVQALLGGFPLGSLQHDQLAPAQLDAARGALEASKAMGITMTNRLLDVQAFLERVEIQRGQAATASDRLSRSAAPQLPAGWGSALDPTSHRRYYWRVENPAGTTTWQCPA